MKFVKLKILIVILTAAVLMPTALAATTEPEPEKTPVQESLDELLSIRDDTSLSEEEKLGKELEIRKEILSEVLSLSLDEVAKLSAKLDGLPEFAKDSREKTLQDEFKADLENYTAYYEGQSKKLTELTTIDEAKTLAQEIKEYRADTYNLRIKETVNFVLIFYNEDVLKIATTRLDKISADIKKLEKLGYLKSGAFDSKLKEAADILNAAQLLQKEAKSAILTPPDEIQNTDETQNTEGVVGEPVVEEPIGPDKLIEESLGKVKSAYDIFLQIGKDLRKILGIE